VPELPEVETVVRDLRAVLVGQRFQAVRVGRKRLRRPWSSTWNRLLIGQTVAAVERRGKWILIDLGGRWIVAHLGMTGQLRLVPETAPRQDHTHIVCVSEGGLELRFRDPRRFGSFGYFEDRAAVDAFLAPDRLGPEPFALEPAAWSSALRRTRRCLKAVLLDQTVIAGVGNIYADEALFEARLHPALVARELSPRRADALRRAIVRVLTRAITRRGSTIRDYLDGNGKAGGYQHEFRVYGRTGEPCWRCKTPIERISLAGRSTHYCPTCQVANPRL
jgi:formamidopyrimidine-DNA glycosylase